MAKPEENIEFKRYKPTRLVLQVLEVVNDKIVENKDKINSDNYYEILSLVYEIDKKCNNILDL